MGLEVQQIRDTQAFYPKHTATISPATIKGGPVVTESMRDQDNINTGLSQAYSEHYVPAEITQSSDAYTEKMINSLQAVKLNVCALDPTNSGLDFAIASGSLALILSYIQQKEIPELIDTLNKLMATKAKVASQQFDIEMASATVSFQINSQAFTEMQKSIQASYASELTQAVSGMGSAMLSFGGLLKTNRTELNEAQHTNEKISQKFNELEKAQNTLSQIDTNDLEEHSRHANLQGGGTESTLDQAFVDAHKTGLRAYKNQSLTQTSKLKDINAARKAAIEHIEQGTAIDNPVGRQQHQTAHDDRIKFIKDFNTSVMEQSEFMRPGPLKLDNPNSRPMSEVEGWARSNSRTPGQTDIAIEKFFADGKVELQTKNRIVLINNDDLYNLSRNGPGMIRIKLINKVGKLEDHVLTGATQDDFDLLKEAHAEQIKLFNCENPQPGTDNANRLLNLSPKAVEEFEKLTLNDYGLDGISTKVSAKIESICTKAKRLNKLVEAKDYYKELQSEPNLRSRFKDEEEKFNRIQKWNDAISQSLNAASHITSGTLSNSGKTQENEVSLIRSIAQMVQEQNSATNNMMRNFVDEFNKFIADLVSAIIQLIQTNTDLLNRIKR